MNILFMSLSDYQTIYFHGLYPDLLKQFVSRGNEIYILSPVERRNSGKEYVIKEKNVTIVKLNIWNMQKANIAEKAISMLTIDGIFIRGLKKYLSDIKFDLILYPTPPITLLKTVEYVKNRDGAKAYLLLKDIFPQNAVDIGMMSTTGIKGLIYKYFRKQEKRLYEVSDHIGCMSQANVDYVIKHNREVEPSKVEVCPNTYDPIDMSCSEEERIEIRNKYGIPIDKTVFAYGGNLGKPQGISFLMKCLHSQEKNRDVYFLIVGDGTEYGKLKAYVDKYQPSNVKLMRRLPKEDYDMMLGACDAGMIFLDHRFTIPNFPSRLLSYMQAKLPVLACTDPNTDIGKVIVDGGFGWWCESNDVKGFSETVLEAVRSDLKTMGRTGFQYLNDHYTAEQGYHIINKWMGK